MRLMQHIWEAKPNCVNFLISKAPSWFRRSYPLWIGRCLCMFLLLGETHWSDIGSWNCCFQSSTLGACIPRVVTSAFRIIPAEWKRFERLNVVVSIDGLQPEHDERRKPATYERILRNIADAKITIHSTITGNIASRPGYLEEFLSFWSSRPEINKIWFSLFTPQIGATGPEILTPAQRVFVVEDLLRLRKLYPKLDMAEGLIRKFSLLRRIPKIASSRGRPTPSLPIWKTKITPCQFGGEPDCAQCGCIASMGLAAVGHHRVLGPLTAGHLFYASDKLGQSWRAMKDVFSKDESKPKTEVFTILQN